MKTKTLKFISKRVNFYDYIHKILFSLGNLQGVRKPTLVISPNSLLGSLENLIHLGRDNPSLYLRFSVQSEVTFILEKVLILPRGCSDRK